MNSYKFWDIYILKKTRGLQLLLEYQLLIGLNRSLRVTLRENQPFGGQGKVKLITVNVPVSCANMREYHLVKYFLVFVHFGLIFSISAHKLVDALENIVDCTK